MYGKKKELRKGKNAFTLIELIIATFIGSIVLLFILRFLGDTMDNMSFGKSNTKILINFSELQNKLNSYKNIYSTGYILKDNNSSTGSDVFLMKNIKSTDGIIISRIDVDTKKIIQDNTIYKNSPLGIRRISKTELISIESNPDIINNYVFKNDKIYYDMILKDFQIKSYNSGSINEFNLIINPYYIDELKGNPWESMKENELLNLNINF